ncbi:NADH-quinone oxidoreductase subunit N [Terriglobus tenax]|uniref:NADH-quinone oxidoreductase subunit N n=1 Tax=Terriglobus tenax TaxID=1111115 RepID=UPI0021DF54DF|nr:NADH-quinone oxidoreductase subunit N [Terriglobus tenax]
MSSSLLSILPELVLTVTGVLIMLADPFFAPTASKKVLGWLAVLGTLASGGAALLQLQTNQILVTFSGTIQVDSFSVFFHLLITAIVLLTLLVSLDYFKPGVTSHSGEYFALVLFGSVGMMLMTCSVELLMVFIGLEISSISTYILAGYRKGQATASESSLKYFLLGSFATAFFLYGIALAFGATGTTSLLGIASGLKVTAFPTMSFLALGMMLVGLGFKVSAAPFHVWTPDVYQGAPAPVVGLMSTAPKAAVFAVLLRITATTYASELLHNRWVLLIGVIAVLSMFVGNLGALLQTDVKRMLAYSSIAHAGYLLVAYTALPSDGISAAAFYTAGYAAMNVGAFAVISQLGYNEPLRSIDDYRGLAQKHPVLAAALSFFLLSLVGIPFTGGFFGKFYVFHGAVSAGHIWLAVLGLLNSGIACFYYLRLLVALYSRKLGEETDEAVSVSPAAAVAIAAAVLATFLLGVLPGKVLGLAQRGATVQVSRNQ